MAASPELFSVQSLFLVAGFAFIGASLAFIDAAFDRGRFDKRLAVLLALPAGLLAGYLIASDVSAATILLAVVFSSLLSGKVDNTAFQLGALATLASVAMFFPGVPALSSAILSLAFVVLVVAGVIDEWGNDRVDAKRFKGAAEWFFRHRMAMKLAALGLFGAGAFQLVYLLAFLCFDTAYSAVDSLGCQ